MSNGKTLYIVWYSHARRAETLSKELNAQLVFIYEAQLKGFWLKALRYVIQGWKTWRLLERERPPSLSCNPRRRSHPWP